MGTYATGCGSAILKKGITKEFIEKLIEENEENKPTEMVVEVDEREISFDESSSHWDGDCTTSYLEISSPYIQKGELDYFTHEDGSSWKYVFNPENEWWEEKYVNELSEYTTKDLIAELRNRGYTVTKKKKKAAVKKKIVKKTDKYSYEYWQEEVMDERLRHTCDSDEKYELYLHWKNEQKRKEEGVA